MTDLFSPGRYSHAHDFSDPHRDSRRRLCGSSEAAAVRRDAATPPRRRRSSSDWASVAPSERNRSIPIFEIFTSDSDISRTPITVESGPTLSVEPAAPRRPGHSPQQGRNSKSRRRIRFPSPLTTDARSTASSGTIREQRGGHARAGNGRRVGQPSGFSAATRPFGVSPIRSDDRPPTTRLAEGTGKPDRPNRARGPSNRSGASPSYNLCRVPHKFHNADSRIMPPEPRLFGSAAHFASRLN